MLVLIVLFEFNFFNVDLLIDLVGRGYGYGFPKLTYCSDGTCFAVFAVKFVGGPWRKDPANVQQFINGIPNMAAEVKVR